MHQNGQCKQRNDLVTQNVDPSSWRADEHALESEKIICEHCGVTVDSYLMLQQHTCARVKEAND